MFQVEPLFGGGGAGDNAEGDSGREGGEHGQKLLAKPSGLEDVWADHPPPPHPQKSVYVLNTIEKL